MKELEDVKESLGSQLKTLQEILDSQIEKYKEQVSYVKIQRCKCKNMVLMNSLF